MAKLLSIRIQIIFCTGGRGNTSMLPLHAKVLRATSTSVVRSESTSASKGCCVEKLGCDRVPQSSPLLVSYHHLSAVQYCCKVCTRMSEYSCIDDEVCCSHTRDTALPVHYFTVHQCLRPRFAHISGYSHSGDPLALHNVGVGNNLAVTLNNVAHH